MTQGAQPNPVTLFEGVANRMERLLAGVKAEQLSSPTPCTEWTVKDLVDHIQGGAEGLAAFLSESNQEASQGGSDAAARYREAASRALEAARNPANLEKSVETRAGAMPGGQFLSIMFMDHLVHGWDLAKATGQDTAIEPALVDACYAMFVPGIDQFRGDAIGPAVPAPEGASTQDKLIAYMGRQP